MREEKSQTVEREVETEGGKIEDELIEVMIGHESELYAINESLVREIEEVIAVFYAYSRSETKIDEKEIQMKEVIA